jgi:hypothetical protein
MASKKQALEKAAERTDPTTEEAAKHMGVEPQAIANLASSGALECRVVTDGSGKNGLGRRFAVEELERRRHLIRPDTV